ncbi:MAG TPA: hypothetical protein VLV31_10105 [Candidatus Acidoferrales bacterium]|nr:hypothetical protein [Candidatus Acidoferrales bacterium]
MPKLAFSEPKLSGLTKKAVYADKVIATLLGVKEGAHVSYAELSKGLHKYIREKNLRKPLDQIQSTSSIVPPIQQAVVPEEKSTHLPELNETTTSRKCRDCGVEIPIGAVFCDLCGVRQ